MGLRPALRLAVAEAVAVVPLALAVVLALVALEAFARLPWLSMLLHR